VNTYGENFPFQGCFVHSTEIMDIYMQDNSNSLN
jgi:hypothetical protein